MADTATATMGPLTVVTFPAEIDMATADAIGEQVAAAIAPGVPAVIADMTATTFCDSAGINMLIRARKQATAHGAELRLLLPSQTSCACCKYKALTRCCRSTTAWKKPWQARGNGSQ